MTDAEKIEKLREELNRCSNALHNAALSLYHGGAEELGDDYEDIAISAWKTLKEV